MFIRFGANGGRRSVIELLGCEDLDWEARYVDSYSMEEKGNVPIWGRDRSQHLQRGSGVVISEISSPNQQSIPISGSDNCVKNRRTLCDKTNTHHYAPPKVADPHPRSMLQAQHNKVRVYKRNFEHPVGTYRAYQSWTISLTWVMKRIAPIRAWTQRGCSLEIRHSCHYFAK